MDKESKDSENILMGLLKYCLVIGSTISPSKNKILNVLISANKPISIYEISKQTGMDYKNTWRYIKIFHKEGIVSLNPPSFSQGKKVMVRLNKTNNMPKEQTKAKKSNSS